MIVEPSAYARAATESSKGLLHGKHYIEITAHDRFSNVGLDVVCLYERFEDFLATQPEELRQTEMAYSHTDAQLIANNRAFAAQQVRRRSKRPETAWVIEKPHLRCTREGFAMTELTTDCGSSLTVFFTYR